MATGRDRDDNCTRGCGYPRLLDPTGADPGSNFDPRMHPHLDPQHAGVAVAALEFHPEAAAYL